MKIKNVVVFSALALLASTAMAGGIPEPVAAAPIATAATVSGDFTPSVYLKANLGYSDNGMKAGDGALVDTSGATNSVSKNGSFAGRIAAGYQPLKYLAFELGYFRSFSKPKVKEINTAGTQVGAYDITVQAVDLVGKILAPLADTGLSLYALAGPGYLMQKESGSSILTDPSNSKKINLVYGFGLMYNIDNNWSLDAGYMQYCSGKEQFSDSKWQSNVRFYSVGVSYKFNLQ